MHLHCRNGLVAVLLGLVPFVGEVAGAQVGPGDGVTQLVAGRSAAAAEQASGAAEAGGGRAGVLDLLLRDMEETRADLPGEVRALTEQVRALTEQVNALGAEVTRVGAWEPFSQNIRDVVENTVEYEYAIVRNGGFRTLTASTWDVGWRVMTTEYISGNTAPFRLAGSIGTWGTNDPRERECGVGGVLHHYYHTQGGGSVSTWGNGCRFEGGEDVIYRRRR